MPRLVHILRLHGQQETSPDMPTIRLCAQLLEQLCRNPPQWDMIAPVANCLGRLLYCADDEECSGLDNVVAIQDSARAGKLRDTASLPCGVL